MSKQQCADRFHPGSYLRKELKARKLTQMIFALQCAEVGLNSMHILQLLSEKRSVNRVLATGIVSLLGGDVQAWLNLQKAYDDWEPEGGK
jgi:plasmid maintenance system antidote protein VapI